MSHHRIGMIIPSSDVTVETEIPALLARHASATFSFHGSRMRMAKVSPEELVAMNAQRSRCVDELADAGVDALLYACLVAVMAQGAGEHRRVEEEVAAQLAERGLPAGLVSSADALVISCCVQMPSLPLVPVASGSSACRCCRPRPRGRSACSGRWDCRRRFPTPGRSSQRAARRPPDHGGVRDEPIARSIQ